MSAATDGKKDKEEEEECGICFEVVKDRGKLETCDHLFCSISLFS